MPGGIPSVAIDPATLMMADQSQNMINERGNMYTKIRKPVYDVETALDMIEGEMNISHGNRLRKLRTIEGAGKFLLDKGFSSRIVTLAVDQLMKRSGHKKFSKGQLVVIEGPEYFPFKVKAIVESTTRNSPDQMSATRTILRTVEYHGKEKIILEGWNDTDTFSMEVGLSNGVTYGNMDEVTAYSAS